MEWTARTRFTARQKAELWERWKSGQCVADIARALGQAEQERCLPDTGSRWRHCTDYRAGRAAAALRLEEREEISRGIAAGRSIRADRPRPRTVAIDGKPGDRAERRQPGLPCKPG